MNQSHVIAAILLGLLSGCATYTPTNELPMYGGVEKNAEEKAADDKFVQCIIENLGSKEKGSDDAAICGWQYFYQNDPVTAMKRFNQAWLLNTNNAQAYWGFGVIIGQRSLHANTEDNLRQSIAFLEIAIEKAPGNARIMTDLAYSHTMLGAAVLKQQQRPSADEEFQKAQNIFEDALMIDPAYPLIHYNWSVLEFYRGNYSSAKAKLDEAMRLGFTPAPDYLKDLTRKKKE